MDVQNSLYPFFRFYVFVNKKRTVIARKLIFFLENIGILILFRMLHIRFRYIEKLRFEKKLKKLTISRNYDLKKRLKKFNLKYLSNLWTNHFAQRTRPRAIKNLPPQGILKRLRKFYSLNRWMYKTHFIYVLGLTFLLIKKEPW